MILTCIILLACTPKGSWLMAIIPLLRRMALDSAGTERRSLDMSRGEASMANIAI